jgi:hypothetical protein
MRVPVLSLATLFLGCAIASSTEVEVAPSKSAQTPSASTPSGTAAHALPQYRPALLGAGPFSVINRIDTQKLLRVGQKDATLMFCCSVMKNGEIADTWIYRQSPDSTALEEDVVFCLNTAVFIPAIYNHHTVPVLFYGTVSFKVVNGKARLRIFANQEEEELKKESDFVGPQPFVGPDSKFEGLHYPNDVLTNVLSGLVELGLKIDADGNLKELKRISEYPPLAGFGRAAVEDFRVAKFIPAFRDGKPVECNVTLPVYYEP